MDLTSARQRQPVRHLCRGLALLAAAAAFPVSALQMGAAQLESFLAQPLLVRIAIVADEGGAVPDADKFRARVLPADAYLRQGLEPPNFGTADLSARVSEGGPGEYWLLVKSGRAFSEPAATLLIELSDGRQTIVRQVDLLLDPEPVDRAPEAQIIAAQPPPAAREQAPAPAAAAAGAMRSYGPVRRGETLVEIAQRVRPDASTDLDRMADALREANPALADVAMDEQAPIGAILRVPEVAGGAPVPTRPRVTQANAPVLRAPTPQPQAPRIAPPPPTAPPVRQAAATPAPRTEPLALATELESYSQRRSSEAALQELDRREPDRYRADWTLDSVPERDAAEAEAPATPDVAEDEAGQDPMAALEQLRAFIDDDIAATDAETEAVADQESGAEAADVILAEPLTADVPDQPADSGSWLITLMLIFGGVAAWAAWPRFGPRLVDQWRARQVPATPGPAPATEPHVDLADDLDEDGDDESMPASLRSLLAEARESADAEVVRQATVAEVMALRGHHADAERVLNVALGHAEPPAEEVDDAMLADDDASAEDDDFGATMTLDEPVSPEQSEQDVFGRTAIMDSVPEAEAEADEEPGFELVSEGDLSAAADQPLDLTLNGDDEEQPIRLELEPDIGDEPVEFEMSAPYEDQQVPEADDEPLELELDLSGIELEEPSLLSADDLASEAEPELTLAEDGAEADEEQPDPHQLRALVKELRQGMRHDEQRQKLREAEAMIDDGQLAAAARLLDYLSNS